MWDASVIVVLGLMLPLKSVIANWDLIRLLVGRLWLVSSWLISSWSWAILWWSNSLVLLQVSEGVESALVGNAVIWVGVWIMMVVIMMSIAVPVVVLRHMSWSDVSRGLVV